MAHETLIVSTMLNKFTAWYLQDPATTPCLHTLRQTSGRYIATAYYPPTHVLLNTSDLFSLSRRKNPNVLVRHETYGPWISRAVTSYCVLQLKSMNARAAPLGQCGQVLPTVGLQTCDRPRGRGQESFYSGGEAYCNNAAPSSGSSVQFVGRDSSVGMAIPYGLDCLRIESWWGGEAFSTRPDCPWGPSSLLYNGYWVYFPPGGGVRRPGRSADYPPSFNA